MSSVLKTHLIPQLTSYRNKVNEEELKFHIWDTDWQDDTAGLQLYYRGCHGILLVYDVTKQNTFDSMRMWLEDIYESIPMPRIIIVGNKCDLDNLRTVGTEDGQQIADSFKLSFYETSALDSTNINEAFDDLVEKVYIANKNISD